MAHQPIERTCVSCKHFRELKGKPNPVHGGEIHEIEVAFVRATLCGWSDPKWWEPKK